jgi:hypothetical protein
MNRWSCALTKSMCTYNLEYTALQLQMCQVNNRNGRDIVLQLGQKPNNFRSGKYCVLLKVTRDFSLLSRSQQGLLMLFYEYGDEHSGSLAVGHFLSV